MRVLDGLFAVLAPHEHVDHARAQRARSIERQDGDDVFEAVGDESPQQLAHARRLELEHRERVAASHQVVRRLVGEVEVVEVDLDAVASP